MRKISKLIFAVFVVGFLGATIYSGYIIYRKYVHEKEVLMQRTLRERNQS